MPRCLSARIEALGFDPPRNIRELIEGNKGELLAYGGLCSTVEQSAGRPATEYWLTEAQAYVVCRHLDAPKAAAVNKMIIDVFMAWRRGQLVSVPLRAPAIAAQVPAVVRNCVGGIVKAIVVKEVGELLDDFERRIGAIDPTARVVTEYFSAMWVINSLTPRVTAALHQLGG